MIEQLEYLGIDHGAISIIVLLLVIVGILNGCKALWEYISTSVLHIKKKTITRKELDALILENQRETADIKEHLYESIKLSKESDNKIRQNMLDLQTDMKNMHKDINNCIRSIDSFRIESQRAQILDFASGIGAGRKYTKEQFNGVFAQYTRYEELLKHYGLTNGEADISIEIIKDAYKDALNHNGFVEDKYMGLNAPNNYIDPQGYVDLKAETNIRKKEDI